MSIFGKNSLTLEDLSYLRIAVLMFSFYCVSFASRPLIEKVFVERSIGMLTVIKRQARFFTLTLAGSCCFALFPFHDALEHRVYFSSISFFVTLFSFNEVFISYTRFPFVLISPTRQKILRAFIFVQFASAIIRTTLDLLCFIFALTFKDDHWYSIFYTAVQGYHTASAVSFSLSEFLTAKFTTDLIQTPPKYLTPDMQRRIKATKTKLKVLANANYSGVAAGILDVINSWMENQFSQGMVLAVGSATYIFYGQLFALNLEDTKRETTEAASRGQSVMVSAANSSTTADKSSGDVSSGVELSTNLSSGEQSHSSSA